MFHNFFVSFVRLFVRLVHLFESANVNYVPIFCIILFFFSIVWFIHVMRWILLFDDHHANDADTTKNSRPKTERNEWPCSRITRYRLHFINHNCFSDTDSHKHHLKFDTFFLQFDFVAFGRFAMVVNEMQVTELSSLDRLSYDLAKAMRLNFGEDDRHIWNWNVCTCRRSSSNGTRNTFDWKMISLSHEWHKHV